MGELDDYEVIMGVVKYDDDPLKFGRIKCDIPGVMDSSLTQKDAMPWIRPLRMHGYQTFSRPLIGEKVWVLISKVNYNEYWWTFYHETIDIVQEFLNEHYDDQPDVFHARNTCSSDVISTFDDQRGYMTKIGDDYVNLKMDRTMKCAFNDCRIMIDGNKVYCGAGDETGDYEPGVKGNQCKDMREMLANECSIIQGLCSTSPLTPLAPHFGKMAELFRRDILCRKLYVN